MTLQLGGDGAITGCTSLENPDLIASGLTTSGSVDAEKVLVASGTAAAPSYTFSGDTDNGLYYAGTNSIGLATAGTNAILIDSSGRVGIGTSSPSALLSLSGASPKITLTSTSTNADSSIDATSSFGSLSISADENNEAASSQIVFNVDGSPKVSIKDTGNVGIGTTSPGHKLVVKDAGSASTSNYLNVISGNAANAGSTFGDTDTD